MMDLDTHVMQHMQQQCDKIQAVLQLLEDAATTKNEDSSKVSPVCFDYMFTKLPITNQY